MEKTKVELAIEDLHNCGEDVDCNGCMFHLENGCIIHDMDYVRDALETASKIPEVVGMLENLKKESEDAMTGSAHSEFYGGKSDAFGEAIDLVKESYEGYR